MLLTNNVPQPSGVMQPPTHSGGSTEGGALWSSFYPVSDQILLGGLIMRMRSLTALIYTIVNKLYTNLISSQYNENQSIWLEN